MCVVERCVGDVLLVSMIIGGVIVCDGTNGRWRAMLSRDPEWPTTGYLHWC